MTHGFKGKNIVVLCCWLGLPMIACAAGKHYGALAYDPATGAQGFTYDYSSPAQASERALQNCGPACYVVAKFVNECAAVASAAADPHITGVGKGDTQSQAEQVALRTCNQLGSNCLVKTWACNSSPEPSLRRRGYRSRRFSGRYR